MSFERAWDGDERWQRANANEMRYEENRAAGYDETCRHGVRTRVWTCYECERRCSHGVRTALTNCTKCDAADRRVVIQTLPTPAARPVVQAKPTAPAPSLSPVLPPCWMCGGLIAVDRRRRSPWGIVCTSNACCVERDPWPDGTTLIPVAGPLREFARREFGDAPRVFALPYGSFEAFQKAYRKT